MPHEDAPVRMRIGASQFPRAAMAGPAFAQGGGPDNGFGGEPTDGASVADNRARSAHSEQHMNGTENTNMPTDHQGKGESNFTGPAPSSPNR